MIVPKGLIILFALAIGAPRGTDAVNVVSTGSIVDKAKFECVS